MYLIKRNGRRKVMRKVFCDLSLDVGLSLNFLVWGVRFFFFKLGKVGGFVVRLFVFLVFCLL